VLSKNVEDRVGMIFSFSLCAVPIWVALVVYFGRELGKLRELRPLGGGEMLLHWKLILFLVDFQDKTSTV